jgi:hypothetical protein
MSETEAFKPMLLRGCALLEIPTADPRALRPEPIRFGVSSLGMYHFAGARAE